MIRFSVINIIAGTDFFSLRLCICQYLLCGKFSIITFQKINVPAISQGSIMIIFQKCSKQFCRNLAGFCPFKKCEIPGVLALFTPIDQPHINIFSVSVDPEFTRIHKLLLFPASPATVINTNLIRIRCCHRQLRRQVFCLSESFGCSFWIKKNGGIVLLRFFLPARPERFFRCVHERTFLRMFRFPIPVFLSAGYR